MSVRLWLLFFVDFGFFFLLFSTFILFLHSVVNVFLKWNENSEQLNFNISQPHRIWKTKNKKKTICTVRNNIHFVYRNHAIYSNDDVNELRQWLWWWCCSPLFHIGRMEVRSVILFCCSLLYIVAVFLGFVFVIFLCSYCCCRWKCFCIDIFISLRPSFFSVLYSMPNGFG